MEKLICPACGAPLTPDSSQPLITCEYCDTAIENKYYAAPAVQEKAQEPAVETVSEAPEDEFPGEESAFGGSLLKTLAGVGTALAASSLRRRSRAAIVHRPSAARPVLRSGHPSMPHRHPQPPRTGGMGARPARRPAGHGGMPARGMGGRGGRGGMGGPGGRHR